MKAVLTTLAVLVCMSGFAQVGRPMPPVKQKVNLRLPAWQSKSEAQLNLNQDVRNLVYGAGFLAAGFLMNNNGNDRVAVSVAVALAPLAIVDNITTLRRRNKKLNP